MSFRYYCLHCGWNARVEIFISGIGARWVCKTCGSYGLCSDPDSPKLIPMNAQGKYETDFDFSRRTFPQHFALAVQQEGINFLDDKTYQLPTTNYYKYSGAFLMVSLVGWLAMMAYCISH